jgi:hypothetical protein
MDSLKTQYLTEIIEKFLSECKHLFNEKALIHILYQYLGKVRMHLPLSPFLSSLFLPQSPEKRFNGELRDLFVESALVGIVYNLFGLRSDANRCHCSTCNKYYVQWSDSNSNNCTACDVPLISSPSFSLNFNRKPIVIQIVHTLLGMVPDYSHYSVKMLSCGDECVVEDYHSLPRSVVKKSEAAFTVYIRYNNFITFSFLILYSKERNTLYAVINSRGLPTNVSDILVEFSVDQELSNDVISDFVMNLIEAC